jgi:hypothetical protein
MNVSNEEAQESLAAIKNTMDRTRKAVAAINGSYFLILWGSLWIAAYTTIHFYNNYARPIIWTMAILGNLGTFVIWPRVQRNLPVKESTQERLFWRIGGLWGTLFLYVFIWLSIFSPTNGIQINAFIMTAVMFASIVLGLWFAVYFMVWLGLAVTATTLVGFFLLPHYYYCLWMAVTAGGLLLGTGFYLRIRWCAVPPRGGVSEGGSYGRA